VLTIKLSTAGRDALPRSLGRLFGTIESMRGSCT
jgi:hypothetical protein